jgi:Xaa-Pro aminopeptidase
VVNATDIFMGVQDGLRVTNEPAQIAHFEYAAAVTSNAVLSLLRHLQPGVAENDLERQLDSRGIPLSCHRMISFGAKAQRGLASPGPGRAALGDVFTTALGVQGSLTCRAGTVAHSPDELPDALRDFYPRFAANYFEVVRAWYEAVGVGVRAGVVVDAVARVHDASLFRFAVNPGHYLHLDEWVNSPFVRGSGVKLRSGMALQMDIIPVSLGPFCYINAEDGVVLADGRLRRQLETLDAAMWRRMLARRTFMQEQLGITLSESVLPLSNIPGWLPPYGLDLGKVLCHSAAG